MWKWTCYSLTYSVRMWQWVLDKEVRWKESERKKKWMRESKKSPALIPALVQLLGCSGSWGATWAWWGFLTLVGEVFCWTPKKWRLIQSNAAFTWYIKPSEICQLKILLRIRISENKPKLHRKTIGNYFRSRKMDVHASG